MVLASDAGWGSEPPLSVSHTMMRVNSLMDNSSYPLTHSVVHLPNSIEYITWDIRLYYTIGIVLGDFAQL